MDVVIEKINGGGTNEAESSNCSEKNCFCDSKFDGLDLMVQIYN